MRNLPWMLVALICLTTNLAMADDLTAE